MTLVSILMPVWKPRSDWLHEAVASVLAEKACDIELIVIDDGNDVPVSATLADVDDSRLRLIRVLHCGPYAARNAGLKAVRGDYVRFFDADDIVAQRSTGRLLAAAQAKGKETIAYGWTMMCDEQLNSQRLVSDVLEGQVAEQHLLGRFDVYIHAMLCPKAVIDRVGPWEENQFRLMGDRDFVQRLLEQAPVCGIGDAVTLYRRHSTSLTRSSRTAEAVQAGLQVLDNYFVRYPEKRCTDLERAAYANLHLYRSRQFLKLGKTGASLSQLIAAARHDPPGVMSLVLSLVRKRVAELTR